MQLQRRSLIRIVCALLIVSFAGTALLLAGCTPAKTGEDTATRSEELTPGEFPEKTPAPPMQPPPPQLRDPQTAVYSYLLWISYAYRILNSDVASPTFSPYEEVRVNSYVQLNLQEQRAIDQRLLDVQVRDIQSGDSTATVAVTETWKYRYIDTKTGDYSTPAYDVSYDTTYTVVKNADGGWVVDKVAADSRSGEVK